MENPETLLQTFFAFEDVLMLEHVEGAIEITEQQYNDALAAKMAGRQAFVRDGELVIFSGVMRTIWNYEDYSRKEIDENELIPEGWTDKERKTAFDRWMDGEWVTDVQSQHQWQVNQVSETRYRLYLEVDRLRNEAVSIAETENDLDKAREYKLQADALYLKIRAENPWPVNPEA
ncbi:phage tail protein [Vibrio cholerae]|uniref:phage tail protein n=1 Tax=Vibrio cholerae TaxID=666 RepID=UPI00215C2B10|nr:phage tail protein [Vibrio cholerae]MCR9970285.1 phage tail protein [Vibrio cholerae]